MIGVNGGGGDGGDVDGSSSCGGIFPVQIKQECHHQPSAKKKGLELVIISPND